MEESRKFSVEKHKIFFVFSLIFFAGGLFLLIYQKESKIILSITPLAESYAPKVFHQSKSLTLSEGRIVIMVKDEHNISVSTDELINKINELRFGIDDQKEVVRKLQILNANNSIDSGF